MSQLRPSRYERLCAFLVSDPENQQLIADAAAAALDEGRAEEAAALLDRSGETLPPALANLRALAALQLGDAETAGGLLEPLHAAGEGGAPVRFNLALARQRCGRHEDAVALLDDEVLEQVPAAALLRVRSLHHLGRVDDALTAGEASVARGNDSPELMAALASLALDAEDKARAASYAARAGGTVEGLAATGTLLLDEGRIEEALPVLRQAVVAGPTNARAAAALGSALLAKGEAPAAAAELDRAAAAFGDHPGSWIASGWAHLVAGQRDTARARFESGLACDDTFAESHGAIGVVDILDGRPDEGRRRLEIAARLDKNCFSAALGRTLLLEREGAHAAAERVRRTALSTPIDPDGRTMGEAIAAMARGSAPKPE